ncbi:hypothetical protein D3X11_00295 [Streptococcus sp. X16XC17]|nr:hypothetical protein D3X11_00295 [Streptococcus sp. X16XC17]
MKKHLYTRDRNEYNVLSTRGWNQEGIAFYGLTEAEAIGQQQVQLEQGKADFLARIQQGALDGWYSNGILPSISAAQAILESGWGNSALGQAPNYNLFGIKVSTDWTGGQVILPTKEYKDGKAIIVDAAFRTYSSWDESIRDHANFFTSTEWRKNRYQAVFGQRDYKSAAVALQAAGYATDPEYSNKLISVIERYGLYEWDKLVLY